MLTTTPVTWMKKNRCTEITHWMLHFILSNGEIQLLWQVHTRQLCR